MALKVIGNMYGDYHAKLEDGIASTSARTAGEAVYVSSGKWVVSNTNGVIDGIVIKGCASSGYPVVEYVVPGAMIEADLEGTLSANLVAGVKTAVLVADSDNVDATKYAGGHLRVLSVDSTNSKIVVVPTKTFLYTTST